MSEGNAVETIHEIGLPPLIADLDKHVEQMIHIRKVFRTLQGHQKRYYDAKHSKDKCKYKVGTLVLLKNCRKHTWKGSKLKPNWTGHYKSHEVLGKRTFCLASASNVCTT